MSRLLRWLVPSSISCLADRPTYYAALQPVKSKPFERGDAKPLALVPRGRDMAAGLPGTHSTSDDAVSCARPF